MINVTKSTLPPKQEFYKLLDGIFERSWLTNNGPLVVELEKKVKDFLSVSSMLYLNNGTIALQIAIKALELKGEVITTPFSYVATTSSIVWEGCTPVFVDVDPDTFNIDPSKIEAAITSQTSGILATHVFGNPCDIEAISIIAKKHNLKVIYDAAHCFGTKFNNSSVFNFGDISTTSFHATKIFHTAEGGAVFSNQTELIKRMEYHRNFGHETPEEFAMVGINGKCSEFHAAVGLSLLPNMESILNRRKELSIYYTKLLEGLNVRHQKIQSGTEYNYSYYPIVFRSEDVMFMAIKAFNDLKIYPRRYFYPSLDTLNYVQSEPCQHSRDLASRILCLPLFHDLTFEQIDSIVQVLIDKKDML